MRRVFVALLCFFTAYIHADNILTTTRWISAYVEVAGGEAYNFAPDSMSHPPEYELTPMDIQSLSRSDLFIYGGYEVMVPYIIENLEIAEDKLLQIKTGYNYSWIEEAVLSIADRLGTSEIAKRNLLELKTIMDAYRAVNSRKVAVHFHQQALLKSLGYNVVAVFGPGPVNPKDLLSMKNSGAEFIIDNFHGPVGGGISEVLPIAEYYQFMNFPGQNSTETLLDVVSYNMEQIYER